MDGCPRFILGTYISGGGYSPDPAYWERQFFSDSGWGLHDIPLNVVLPYWLGNMPLGPTQALLDVLHAHGLTFLLTGNGFNFGSWTRQPFALSSEAYVRAYAQHPAALGYYIADEPAETLIPETVAHHAQLKSWDPDGVTLAVLMAGYVPNEPTRTNPAHWRNAADILAVDPYPLYGPEPAAGYTHFTVADYVSKLRYAARPDRPVWAVPQLFKFTSNSRLPTPAEMRTHAVMSIVEGAQGLLWWDIGVNGLRKDTDPATVQAYMGHLRTLVTELAGLEDAILAPDRTAELRNSTQFPDPIAGRIAQLQHNDAVEWLYSRKEWYRAEIAALRAGDLTQSGRLLQNAASVRTRASIANGHGYVFAYNYTNVPQPVTFDVPGAESYHFRVHESASGQSFPVTGASWSDTFAPYQSRIYILSV